MTMTNLNMTKEEIIYNFIIAYVKKYKKCIINTQLFGEILIFQVIQF